MTGHGASGRPEPFGPLDRHMDAGAYALGVLDDADAAAFERHLATCEKCAARLTEFSGLLPVLAEMGQAGLPEPPPAAMLDALLAEVTEERRVRRRKRRLASVAAAALIAAGPTAALLATQDAAAPPPAASQQVGEHYSATDRGTGVSATVGLTGKQWGTRVDLRLSHVKGPRDCSLVAVGKDGGRQTVATWTVPGAGYRDQGTVGAFTVTGSTGMRPSAISHFDVVTTQGERLVTVSA